MKRHPSDSVSNSAVVSIPNLVVFWRNFKHMLSEMSNQSKCKQANACVVFFIYSKLIHSISLNTRLHYYVSRKSLNE